MDLLVVKYLEQDLTAILTAAVYIPPSANNQAALCELFFIVVSEL